MNVSYVPFMNLLSNIVDNRGKTCPTAETGIPLIATNCIRNDLLYPAFEKIRYVTEETYATWFRDHPDPGDIIFVTKGTPGRACLTPEPVNFCIAQDMVAVRADETKVHPRYLFAVLRSESIQQQIEQLHVGTLIPHFKKGDFDKLLLPIPDREAQEFIGNLYFELSNKIELNCRMNETLEALARAIFKSWFVDFDPVRAKMEGCQPVGMDAEAAALFPVEFEDSALGQIPKGWKVASLGDVIDVKHGFAFKGEFFRDEPPGDILLTPGNFAIGGGFKADKFKYYAGLYPEEYALQRGDLLATMTDLSKASDTLGYPALVPNAHIGRFLHNQRLGKVLARPDQPVSKLYLFYLMCTDVYRDEVLASATGTTVKHTSPGRIQAFKFPLPENGLALRFGEIVESLHSRQCANDEESRTLAMLRETLLPKLLSGEVRVKDAGY